MKRTNNKIYPLFFLLLLVHASFSWGQQTTPLLQKYRDQALEYDQKIQQSDLSVKASSANSAAAKADMKPKIKGSAGYSYIGNPYQLDLNIGGSPLSFEANHASYNFDLAVIQPIYMGGALKENYRLSQINYHKAQDKADLARVEVVFLTDILYWQAVGRMEILKVSKMYQESVNNLVQIVKQRHQAGLVPRNDLLMSEVKYNEAALKELKAKEDLHLARFQLNRQIGIPLDHQTEIDTLITLDLTLPTQEDLWQMAQDNRLELSIAEKDTRISKSREKLVSSRYNPQIYVGLNGSYSSPGYDFNEDMDPNYQAFAKMEMPIFEWNKRKKESQAAHCQTLINQEAQLQIEDLVKLEVTSAHFSLEQAITQVQLAQSSVSKALENRKLMEQQYEEGLASITEVLDAQIYWQNACFALIQAQLTCQLNRSSLQKSIGTLYNPEL